MPGQRLIGFVVIALVVIALVQEWRYWNAKDELAMTWKLLDKCGKGIDQLKDIVKRCGAELVVDKDGNFDALIPMTPEEFEQVKEEIRRRNK